MASQERVVPAEISEARAETVRERALRIFELLEASGVARIDFILEEAGGGRSEDARGEGGEATIYFNEINTIPGSFSFYLWEPAGVPFSELADRLVEIALDRHRREIGRLRTYDTNLLQEARGGVKTGNGGGE